MQRISWVILGVLFVLLFISLLTTRTQYNEFDGYQYYSVQRRTGGDGRVYENIVKNKDGVWTKSATLYRSDGVIVQKEEKPIDPEHCRAIQHGKFVRNLWADCGPARS